MPYISTFYSSIGSLTVLISAGSLFGVYFAASFLHLDPWHMFFSFPQYLLVSSSYINILNVYAFSNWDDVSWGSKGGKEAEPVDALLRANNIKRKGEGESRLKDIMWRPNRAPIDIDLEFEATMKRALAPYKRPETQEERSRDVVLEESLENFKTRLVAVYIFSKFLLCAIVMNGSFDKLKFLVC